MNDDLGSTLTVDIADRQFELTTLKFGTLRRVRKSLKLKNIYEIMEKLGQLDDDVILTVLQIAIEQEHKVKVSLDELADNMPLGQISEISKFLASAFGVSKEAEEEESEEASDEKK